jgi:hypothetical protein
MVSEGVQGSCYNGLVIQNHCWQNLSSGFVNIVCLVHKSAWQCPKITLDIQLLKVMAVFQSNLKTLFLMKRKAYQP